MSTFAFAQQVYTSNDDSIQDDKKLSSLAEEILGNALLYFNGMLEDANIWISDMVEIDPTIELPNEEN